MLRLAQKAFYPGPMPFPLLHIDTGWKFREMIAFRDRVVERNRMSIDHAIPTHAALPKGIGPITHGSAYHTDVMKTEALKQALDLHGFDVAFRRRPARRGEIPRQGTDFFLSRTGPSLGAQSAAAGTVESLQHADSSGRIDSRFSLIQLDRGGHLGIHRARANSDRAALFRRGAPRGQTLWPMDHGRRPSTSARARRGPRDAPGAFPYAGLLSANGGRRE